MSNKINFDYGVVTYKHRFSLNRSLNDYEEFTLNKCIRVEIVLKYYTTDCDKLVYEIQILHRDENNKVQCLCLDLKEWTFSIKYVGNMSCNI